MGGKLANSLRRPFVIPDRNADHADRRVSSGPRPGGEVRVLSTTSRSIGWTWLGAVTTVTQGSDGCSCSSAWAGGRRFQRSQELPSPIRDAPTEVVPQHKCIGKNFELWCARGEPPHPVG